MKSRIHFKNIFFGVLAGLVVLTVFVTLQANVQASTQPSTLLEKTGGRVSYFELAPKFDQALTTTVLNDQLGNLLGLGDPVVFRLFGQAIFDNVVAFNDTYVSEMFAGYSSIPVPGSGGGSFDVAPALSQAVKLHTNGMIRIDGKANMEAEQYVPACVNDFGKLVRCTESAWMIGGSGEEATNGSCGISNGGSFSSTPSAGLCSDGEPSSVSDNPSEDPQYTWNCFGINGGSNASCSATGPGEEAINGICGEANEGIYAEPPRENLCSAGEATAVYDSGKGIYIWNCEGINGGAGAECTATIEGQGTEPINGACGDAEGGVFSEPPRENLCSMGEETEVITIEEERMHYWTCLGVNGGEEIQCSAILG